MNYFNFPKFPQLPLEYIERLKKPEEFEIERTMQKKDELHGYGRKLTDDIQTWLRDNVMDSHWCLDQFLTPVKIHRDIMSISRLVYPIRSGGDVTTIMYDDNLNILEMHQIKEQQWCMFRTDVWHSAHGYNYPVDRLLLFTTVFKRFKPLDNIENQELNIYPTL